MSDESYDPARLRELIGSLDSTVRDQGIELWRAVGMPDAWNGHFIVQIHGSVLRLGKLAGDIDVLYGSSPHLIFSGERVPPNTGVLLATLLARRWAEQQRLPYLPVDAHYGARVPAYRPLTEKDRVLLLGTSPPTWFRHYKTATGLMRWAGESGDEGTLIDAAENASRIYPDGARHPRSVTNYCGEGFHAFRSAWAKLSRGQQQRFLGYLEEAHGAWWAEFFRWGIPGGGEPSYYMVEAAAMHPPSTHSNQQLWFGPECGEQDDCPRIYDIFTVA